MMKPLMIDLSASETRDILSGFVLTARDLDRDSTDQDIDAIVHDVSEAMSAGRMSFCHTTLKEMLKARRAELCGLSSRHAQISERMREKVLDRLRSKEEARCAEMYAKRVKPVPADQMMSMLDQSRYRSILENMAVKRRSDA